MNRFVTVVALGLFVTSCTGSGNGTGSDGGHDGGYPDPAFIHEATGQLQTMEDTVFLQERPTFYRTTDRLPDLDVRALSLAGGTIRTASASGLLRYDAGPDIFVRETLAGGDGAVVDLAPESLADGRLPVALADGVELHDPAGMASVRVAVPAGVTAVTADGDSVWVGTDQGLGRIQGAAFAPVGGAGVTSVSDLALDTSGDLWIATPQGLVRFDGAQATSYDASGGELPDDDVRSVVALPDGGVLAGCATGAARVGTTSDRILPAGKGALPNDDITAVHAAGTLLAFGHGIGATVVEGDFARVDHYHSLRWIPAERVNAVLLDGDRRRWVATPGGITRIELEESTLSAKADLFENLCDLHWRLDFVSDQGHRDDPWDLAAPLRHWDHDNDGLWTQLVVGAWSYAAAATGDQAYCDKARRAMGAMMQQIDLPAVTFEAAGKQRGFVTRSYVRDDEEHVFESKATQDNWHLVTGYDGHDYYWKDDTSSDETTGHFFGYPLFYDFCAKDEAEREILAEHAAALATYIIDGGFQLIDLDGEKTSHGHWNPDRLAIALDGLSACSEEYPLDFCVEARHGGGWLNGIEILGHMLAAWHMTGDPVFYDAYEALVSEHRYAELVDFTQDVFTVTQRSVANHSDHELAFLAYHTLIRYDPNDDRRQRWIQSMLDMYEWEIAERNPWWSSIIAGFVPDGYHLDDAIQTLREWPEDWREWLVDNSHRKDVTRDVNDRHGDAQFTTVLPYDEIRTMKWNGNPYVIARGGDGRASQAPWPWLLPYWMYRYHGIIR